MPTDDRRPYFWVPLANARHAVPVRYQYAADGTALRALCGAELVLARATEIERTTWHTCTACWDVAAELVGAPKMHRARP